MSQMPDTHQVLLKTMLQYELDNFLHIKMRQTTNYKTDEYRMMLDVQDYLIKRIKELT